MTEASGIKSKLSTTIYFSCIWGPFTPWRGYGQSTFDSREIPFCFAFAAFFQFAAFFLILKQKLEKIPTYWEKSHQNWKKAAKLEKMPQIGKILISIQAEPLKLSLLLLKLLLLLPLRISIAIAIAIGKTDLELLLLLLLLLLLS